MNPTSMECGWQRNQIPDWSAYFGKSLNIFQINRFRDDIMAIPKKTGEPFRKSTGSQVKIRQNAAFKLLLNGYSNSDLIRYYAEQYKKTGNKLWNVGERTVSNDVAAFKKELESLASVHREEELGRARARLDNLYRLAMADHDLKTALSVEKTRIELFRLNEIVDDGTDESLDEFIAALQSRIIQRRKSKKVDEEPEDE